jgi:hypothetical protein
MGDADRNLTAKQNKYYAQALQKLGELSFLLFNDREEYEISWESICKFYKKNEKTIHIEPYILSI